MGEQKKRLATSYCYHELNQIQNVLSKHADKKFAEIIFAIKNEQAGKNNVKLAV